MNPSYNNPFGSQGVPGGNGMSGSNSVLGRNGMSGNNGVPGGNGISENNGAPGGNGGVSGGGGVAGFGSGNMPGGAIASGNGSMSGGTIASGNNNMLGRAMPPGESGMPITSGTGDVILNNGGGSGKKRGLVILLIVLVVLAIVGGIVAWLVLPKMGGGGKKVNDTATSMEESFNQYANFLIDGSTSVAVVDGQFNSRYAYSVGTAFYEKNEEYFERLNAFWTSFMTLFEKSRSEEEYMVLDMSVDIQNQLMSFVNAKFKNEIMDSRGILSKYLELGENEAKDFVADKYDELMKQYSYDPIMNYIKTSKELALLLIEQYNYYNGNNCIVNNVIETECASNAGVPMELVEKVSGLQNSESLQFENEMIIALIRNCYGIASEIKVQNSVTGFVKQIKMTEGRLNG